MKHVLAAIVRGLTLISEAINRVCWVTAAAFLLVMLAAVALQVTARYVFFFPPSWTEELARYCMIWGGYLGATVSFYRREDPILMGSQNLVEGKLSVFFMLVRNIAVLLFIVPIVYWSPVIIRHHMLRETESMELISGYVMLIIPLFAGIVVIHTLARVIGELANRYGNG